MNYYLHFVKKLIYTACIFDLHSLKGLPEYGWNFNTPTATERVHTK